MALPDLLERAQIAVCRLVGYGQELLGRIQAARAAKDTSYLSRRHAQDPARAEQIVTRTLEWIRALQETLAGSATYLLTLRPRTCAAIPLATAARSRTLTPLQIEARRLAARRRSIRRSFAVTPTNRLALRLARRLGVLPSADAWPANILSLEKPPADYGREARLQHTPEMLAEWKRSQAMIHANQAAKALELRLKPPDPPRWSYATFGWRPPPLGTLPIPTG